MDESIRSLGESLGRSALARDWASVHKLLAPWLRASVSVDGVREFFEDEYALTLQDNGLSGVQYPQYPDPEVDGNNFMNATKLREPIEFEAGKIRPLAPEVTDESMRFWMKVRLLASDEQADKLGFDCFCEVWMAIVETREGLRIGYWSQGAY